MDLTGGLFVTLEVSDTGSGMDKETKQRLFEPFYTTKFAGRGLGLSAVLGMVRGHHGALKVYSEPGKGTTFKLLFPAAEPGVDSSPGAGWNHQDRWKGTGTVLLVDDEESIRALGKRMFEQQGARVLIASDGLDALEVYSQHKGEIFLVLLDLTTPHMNGEEAYRELRRIDPHVRVLLSSGYTELSLATFVHIGGKPPGPCPGPSPVRGTSRLSLWLPRTYHSEASLYPQMSGRGRFLHTEASKSQESLRGHRSRDRHCATRGDEGGNNQHYPLIVLVDAAPPSMGSLSS
jgi:hypothetical protein